MPGVRALSTAYVTSTSAPVTIPAGAVTGDILVLFASGTSTITNPSGWTQLDNQSGTNVNGLVSWKTAGPSDPGATQLVPFAAAGAGELAVIAVPPNYVTPTVVATRTAASTSGSVTITSVAGGVLLWLGQARSSSATISCSRTVTVEARRITDSIASLFVGSEDSPGGSVTASFTASPSTSSGSYYAAVSFTGFPTISGGGQLSATAGAPAATISGGGNLAANAGAPPGPVSGGGDLAAVSEDYDENPGPAAPDLPATEPDPPVDTQPDPDADPDDPIQLPDPVLPAPVVRNEMRVSRTYPSPSRARGRPRGWEPTSEVVEEWGHWRIYVSGVDRTIFRGAPTRIGSYSLAEPFGCGPASLVVPMITPWDQPGHGSLSWLQPGEPVVFSRVKPDGATDGRWWGVIGSEDPQLDQDSWTYSVSLVGNGWVGDLQTHKPKTYMPPTDIGAVIPDVLNAVVSRRVPKMSRVTTGILTTQRGSGDSGVLEYVQSLLATATTDDGSNQWTVARASGVNKQSLILKLKDRTTQHWTVRAGQPGVHLDLKRDATQAANRIYGRGVGPDGYSWGNWVYPNSGPDAAPAYPFSSSSSVITIGTSDADTTSGSGVSDWQRRVNTLNITGDVTVDGVYNSNDAAACRVIQGHYGLTVDGVVGPQTWAATFDVGANGANLDGAFRLPLAYDKHVMPRLYNADGSDAGPNPFYDATMLVVDRDENFGSGVTKTEGRRSAAAELARERDPGWAGTITLTADPPEGSRWDVREGQNILVQGWFKVDVLLHIAQVSADPWGGTVTLTVDEKARDLVTLAGILTRNRDSKEDPARLPTRKQRRSKLTQDSIVEFDGESAGGFIPQHALYGGLWTVIRIPVSQAGSIAKIDVKTTSPASSFLLALFGDAITPAQLVAKVGENPLATRTDGYGPFDQSGDDLVEQFGFIEAFGGPGQSAGYYPGYETSPYTAGATAVTGRMVSTASITYRSVRPPWIWVAEYAPTSCRISGRILPGPIGD